jgi:hypothetical protein
MVRLTLAAYQRFSRPIYVEPASMSRRVFLLSTSLQCSFFSDEANEQHTESVSGHVYETGTNPGE